MSKTQKLSSSIDIFSEIQSNFSAAPEDSLTELQQIFKHQLKWRKILKRKINKLKKKLKSKLKVRNKLEAQQDDLEQEYKRMRKTLKRRKLELLVEIMQHLKYLKDMAKVIKPAQKIYLQEKKALRRRLLNVKRQQVNTLKEIKPKVKSLQERINELNGEIRNLEGTISYYRQKREEINVEIAEIKMEAERNAESHMDVAKIVYEKASETNIIGFQAKLSEQELEKLHAKSKDREMTLDEAQSEAVLKADLLKRSDKKPSKKQLKSKADLSKKFSGLSFAPMEGDFRKGSRNLHKGAKKGLRKGTKYKSKSKKRVPGAGKERGDLKPISKKLSKRLRKNASNVFYISKEATIVAPMEGVITKPIDKRTMESITLPTKRQGFQLRSVLRRSSSSLQQDAKQNEEHDYLEEVEHEASLTELISLYNVNEHKISKSTARTSLDHLPKIKETRRPSLSFGDKFFRKLIKSQRQSIREKLIIERQEQKQLERQLAEQKERERAEAEIVYKRSSSTGENKLDVLVRKALLSRFRHADVIRKDLPVVDEQMLRTYKRRKPFASRLTAARKSHISDFEFEDEDDTEAKEKVIVKTLLTKQENEFAYQEEEVGDGPAPRLAVDELIKQYLAQLKADKQKVKKVKKLRKRRSKGRSKQKQLPVIPEEVDEPKLVCSCCGMPTLQIGGPCGSLTL